MKFALLLGQLASFMFPTECPSVLSKAWFCELTSDRHFLRLTCQLHGGLPHLQHGACKHRPSPPSQEESYGVLLVSALFLFFLLARHILLCLGSVSVRVSVYRRGHFPHCSPRKGKEPGFESWYQKRDLLAVEMIFSRVINQLSS